MSKIKHWQLLQRQGQPLELKIRMTKERIRQWYNYYNGDVFVSFSGGLDSTVLLHLARTLYPNIEAVYIRTLPYPEILEHIKNTPNVTILKPLKSYSTVIKEYGWPVISKENAHKLFEIRNTKSAKLLDKRLYGDSNGNGKLPIKWRYMIDAPFKISSACCDWMKKKPAHKFMKSSGKYPLMGVRVSESRFREQSYKRYGCNALTLNNPRSWPMAFWLSKNVTEYIQSYNIAYSSLYDMGYLRSGCMFCMFGLGAEKNPNRIQRMCETHPKQWKYGIFKLGMGEVLDYMNIPYNRYIPLIKLF